MVSRTADSGDPGQRPLPPAATTKSQSELALERDLQRYKDNVFELSAAHLKSQGEQDARHARDMHNEREERRRAEAAVSQARRSHAPAARENIYAFCPKGITMNPNSGLANVWSQTLCEVTQPSVAATCSST